MFVPFVDAIPMMYGFSGGAGGEVKRVVGCRSTFMPIFMHVFAGEEINGQAK